VIFFLLQNQRTGGQNSFCLGGTCTSGSREEVGKECRKVNIVQILCAHECKWKNDICCNCSSNRRRGEIKENGGGGEFKYDVFDILQELL
jgi:hypothetical protein